ncbi:hypothetical protein EJB05_23176 [Eragrostis curvula]|uniref:Uncharacterized protein n=1 Tax=Eragrostis curvula TaxID=38414 RepID=A0A5J9V5T8_9POAL|nr:hypothetical protein EJB05_23176 [Eragrostis curvula]
MQPQRRAADAGAAEHLPLARVEGRAKVSTGSSSVGVPEKQHVVRETAAGVDGPCEEQMPEKLLRHDERVGAIASVVVGALGTNRGGKEKMKAPSRLPGRMTSTSIIGTKADAGMNTHTSCSSQQLCSTNVDARSAPSTDAHHNTTARSVHTTAKEKAAMSSSQRMPERHIAKQTDLNGERLANQKLHKGSSGEMPKKLQAKPRMTSSSLRVNAKTGRPLGGNSTAKDCIEPHTKENTVVHVQESYDIELKEADDAIRRLNELGLGEDISPEEYIEYFEKLPDDPVVNTYFKLDSEQMIALYLRHARYRIRFYKLSQRASRDTQNCAVDLLEKEDFSDEFLHEMEYFVKFEKDGTFDWSFHPDLCKIRDLDDYQRLVPHETGTYADWDKYRRTFHSYETELEYLRYCNELSEKLKWMEDYVLIEVPSLKWGKISTRGASQAMKIATKFSKITPSLADTAYYECVGNMRFNALWLKDMVVLYFEIWVLVAKQKKSLRSAMKEVYDLNKVSTTACKLRYALKYNCSEMETEFRTYTENVPSGATEDEAHSLIAEAVKKLARRPKFYQDYIRKKIDIAQSIGLIPVLLDVSSPTFLRRRLRLGVQALWESTASGSPRRSSYGVRHICCGVD